MRLLRSAPSLPVVVFGAGAGLAALASAACDPTQADERRGTRTDCVQCHREDYEGARRHVDEKPTTCGVCHSETSWHRAKVEHVWPLTGKHEKAKCFACHSGSPRHYKDTSKACVSCHAEDAEPPPFADHRGFGDDCGSCHSTEGWKPAEHNGQSGHGGVTPPPSATAIPTVLPSATVTSTGTASARPRPTTTTTTTAPKPKPTAPKPWPTQTSPDIISHPSGR